MAAVVSSEIYCRLHGTLPPQHNNLLDTSSFSLLLCENGVTRRSVAKSSWKHFCEMSCPLVSLKCCRSKQDAATPHTAHIPMQVMRAVLAITIISRYGTITWPAHSPDRAVDSSWNIMTHVDAREEKWRGNWRMEWVASTLHTTSEHGVPSIITADAQTSAASSRLNWRPRRFNPLNTHLNPICHLLALLEAHHILHFSRTRVKWTRPFRRKTKSGFCACTIAFQLASSRLLPVGLCQTGRVGKQFLPV